MALALLVAFLVGCVVMAAMLFGAAWKTPGRAKWFGLFAILAAAPFFYWLGVFSEHFGAGLCYSNTMLMVANAVERTDSPRTLAGQLRALPMRGYETACSEVEAAAKALPNAGAP